MPSLALAVSLFVLSQSALLVRLAKEASALDIGLWRMVVAVPLLILLGVLQGRLGEIRRVRKRQLFWLAVCGLTLFSHWWTWFLAVQQTALANSMVFFAISPIFTAVGAWIFFREPFHKRHGVAMLFCFAGVVLIVRDSLRFVPEHFQGDCLALIASALFSAYVLVGKGIRKELGNISFTVFTYSFCGLLFAAVLILKGGLRTDFSANTWLALASLAIGPTLLGHALFTYCLQFFNVNLMNILILSEPIFGSLVAYLVLGESFSHGVIAGFLTISAGVMVLFLPALAKGGAAK